MALNDEHTKLLDQLQSQVNSVLEQTGRVFAALSTNPNVHPTAQVNKLKNTLPAANDQFHDALDQLENDLQLASIVMRRDLALCRERSGVKKTSDVEPASAAQTEHVAVDSEPADMALHASEPEPSKPDIEMAEPDIKPTQGDIQMQDIEQNQREETKPPPSFEELIAEGPAPDPPMQDTKPSVAAHTHTTTEEVSKELTDLKPPPNDLSIDTKAAEENKSQDKPSDDDKAPDTANDLDSLFGGPISAEPGESNDFNFDQNTSNDLDFDSFGTNFDAGGADNDDLSSLLPGLQDYANNQQDSSGGDVDLNALFGNTEPESGVNQRDAGEQHDNTFDDLLADFDGGVEDDGNGNNSGTFDFDSLFE